MYINACATMSKFGHNAGKQRHLAALKFVGNTVNHDRPNSRITEYYLVITFGCRVSIVGGTNVPGQKLS
jgi:hypothetical protein